MYAAVLRRAAGIDMGVDSAGGQHYSDSEGSDSGASSGSGGVDGTVQVLAQCWHWHWHWHWWRATELQPLKCWAT